MAYPYINDGATDLAADEARFAVIREAPLNAASPPDGTAAVEWDGVTDDTAALTAIAALLPQTGTAELKGGEIILPRGRGVAHGWNLDNTLNVVLKGHGGGYGGTQIISHSTSSTAVVSAKSTGGLRMEGISIYNDQAAFTGKLIDLDKGTGQDTALFKLTDLRLVMIGQAGSSAIGISVANAISGVISGCYITGGKAGVRGRTVNTQYSNAISIQDRCFFQGQDIAAILNPYEWVLRDCVFEPLRDGSAGAVLCEAAIPAQWLGIRDCWTGDAPLAPAAGAGTWYHVHGTGISFDGGAVDSGGATASGIKLRSGEPSKGLSVVGVYFNGINKGIDLNGVSVSGCRIGPNVWGTVTTRISGNTFGTPSLVVDDDFTLYKSGSSLRAGQALVFDGDHPIYQQDIAAGTSFVHRVKPTATVNDRYQLTADGTITRGLGSVAATIKFLAGAGTPEGAITAGIGSIYQRTDGGAATSMYVKESGVGNTGWVAK